MKANATGGVQLRLDAIDALETHYPPPHAPTPWHQSAELGDGAAKALLDLLGFGNVVRDERGYVTSSTPDETPGYVLTPIRRQVRATGRHGLPMSSARVVRRRRPGLPRRDRAARLGQLPALGSRLVYPTFYSQLYVDLRADLASTAIAARDAQRGVWAHDATLPGFTLTARDELVILPKLFRRLAEYLTLDETGGASLTGFSPFLAAHNDRVFRVPAGQATSLDPR